MTIRDFEDEDEPVLRELYGRFGYKWDFPEDLSGFQVVTDDSGRILMAAGWKLVPEITMICEPDKTIHPLVKLQGIAMLHDKLRSIITASGFNEAMTFVDPVLGGFARHLQREFGWQADWPSFRLLGGK